MRTEPAGITTTSANTGSPRHLADQFPPVIDRRFVTAALMLVMVLASMEMTITSTAMPTIIGELHGLQHYAWVASIYLLAGTVTMPLYGRLADALGRKPVIVVAILLFTLGSVLAAFAQSMTQLIIFRGLQGLGAGGIMPVVLTILGDIFTLEERARIQGVFSAVWGTSALAGPALGAFLVNTLGWRSVFFVNLPFAAMALLVLIWKYHDRERPHKVDLDLAGVMALGVGCSALLALVSRMGPDGWSWSMTIVLAAIMVGSLAYFLRHERRSAQPILPPSLLMNRMIGPSILGTFFFGLCFLSLDTYVPLYVQGGRGGGPTAAASVVTPVMLTWALSGVIAAPLMVRWGFRRTATIGSVLIIIGFTGLVLCAQLEAPQWMLTGILSITGLGFGPTSMAYLLAAQHAVQWHQRGSITSSVGFFRSIGGAVGIGLLGAMFNMIISDDLRRLKSAGITPASLLDPHTLRGLPQQVVHSSQQMIASGLIWVFVIMLIVAAVQLFVTTLLPEKHAEAASGATDDMEGMAA